MPIREEKETILKRNITMFTNSNELKREFTKETKTINNYHVLE